MKSRLLGEMHLNVLRGLHSFAPVLIVLLVCHGVFLPAVSWASLVSSVLPTSRSTEVGNTVTAFATVINVPNPLESTTATGCSISPITSVPATFVYQTTDPLTNALVGTPNTPVDIAPGAQQSFVFAFTPTAPFAPTDVELSFDCTNTNPAATISGLNTLLLSGSSTPVPDIIPLATTGLVYMPVYAEGIAAVAVATVNVGSKGTITASADTCSAVLPVSISVCETNPVSGTCINPTVPASTATITIAAGETPSFAFFLTASDPIPYDPAYNRMFARFTDAGQVVRGATSVALSSDFSTIPNVTGTYNGSGAITSTGCIDPADNMTIIILYSSVSIPTQSSQSFSGEVTALWETKTTGVTATLDGTIEAQGAVSGTMTTNSFDIFSSRLLTSSSGTFSGSFSNKMYPATLSFQFSLQDTFGDTCMRTGSITVSR
jgi:hypothetical protein